MREDSFLGLSTGGFHRVAYTEWGEPEESRLVVCVHGLTRNGRDFDRLAEALAERMHERVRKEIWAYKTDEQLDNEALIDEKYQGIRPAPGYPACPDHTEKGLLWELLDVEQRIGMTLTESYAMLPTAAVSGFYFAHPESRYFGLGKITEDQVKDYAQRKNWDLPMAERWLAPALSYDGDD